MTRKRKEIRRYIELGGVGLLAFVGIFATLAIVGKKDYAGASESTKAILDTKPALEAFVNGEANSFGDAERAVFTDFEKAVEDCEREIETLKRSNVTKDDKAASDIKDVEAAFSRLKSLAELEKLYASVANDDSLSDEDLEALKSAENYWVADFAKGLSEYRAAADELISKYSNVDDYDEVAMQEDFGNVQLIGRELSKKYENSSFYDMLGFEKEEIWQFYDKVEELNNYFIDKK